MLKLRYTCFHINRVFTNTIKIYDAFSGLSVYILVKRIKFFEKVNFNVK